MQYVALVVFIIEVCLSHATGETSGNQSRWLSSMTGVKEGLLRRSMHVILFALLSYTAGAGFSWYGIVGVAVWALLDEVTKPIIPGRHFCLWPDVVLNLVGFLIGLGIWWLTKAL